ncbi:ribonuclease H-like domain-containing protein [Tanacetum coccineum]
MDYLWSHLQEEAAPAGEQSGPPAPKTAKQLTAKRNQERVKSILLLAIPNEYLLKFHNFENFNTAPNESLDKAYDRFQKLISQLEVYAAPVSKEDINQKFLRSLPPSWSQIALIMRYKPDIYQIEIDDLYNNLRVYEDEMKSTASGNFRVNTAGGTSSTSQVSSTLGADEVSKVECYNYHRKGHFAKECKSGRNQGKISYGGYDWSNDFVEPVNYALMAIFASSSSGSSDKEVQNCSKQCLESFKTLQKNFDSEREKHSRARLEIQGYELALESLESRILGHEKNELAWGEKYDQMSAKDKNGLGYGTQLDEISNKSETGSEISMSVFEVRSSDEEITPANDRFSKADGYHVVPPPITGNFLTPRANISFAGKTNEVNIEKPKSVHESVVPKPKINRDKVIIEDWNSDDEDDVSAVKTVSPVKTNETQTVRNRVDKIGQISQKERIGFRKIKTCFVYKSTDHLIKDYDFYAKKSPEPKMKTVVNTGQRVVKPVWDNAKRVNQQKISNNLKYPQERRTFIPSGVLTRTSLVNPVMPNGKRAVHTLSTARPFAPKIAQTGSAIRPIYPRMDNVIPRASYSQIKRSYYTKPAFRPKNLKQDVKTSGVKNMTTTETRAVVNTGKGKMDNDLKKSRWVWRPKENYMDHESKEKGSFILKKFEYGNPESILQDHAVVDSGCSSHMTGNKAYLSDYKDYNGDFVAFGSDPKGDRLKFNLFSVSQMCDKKNSVLFTDTECLILSPSFKLLDESQVVLKAPRQNGVYNLDLKNIVPSGWIKRELVGLELTAKMVLRKEKNRTLIGGARTMLADSLLPIPFWAEAVNLLLCTELGSLES